MDAYAATDDGFHILDLISHRLKVEPNPSSAIEGSKGIPHGTPYSLML
jgi:hypothetical protein